MLVLFSEVVSRGSALFYYPSTETEHHKCYFRKVIDQQICSGAPYLGRPHGEILALFVRAGMKVRD
jgi:hypothetical protein